MLGWCPQHLLPGGHNRSTHAPNDDCDDQVARWCCHRTSRDLIHKEVDPRRCMLGWCPQHLLPGGHNTCHDDHAPIMLMPAAIVGFQNAACENPPDRRQTPGPGPQITGLVACACMWRTNRHECVIPASSCPSPTAAHARWWRADRISGVLSKLSQLPPLSPPRATAPVICSSQKGGRFKGIGERMNTLVGMHSSNEAR
jgi:hypothetical protein